MFCGIGAIGPELYPGRGGGKHHQAAGLLDVLKSLPLSDSESVGSWVQRSSLLLYIGFLLDQQVRKPTVRKIVTLVKNMKRESSFLYNADRKALLAAILSQIIRVLTRNSECTILVDWSTSIRFSSCREFRVRIRCTTGASWPGHNERLIRDTAGDRTVYRW